MKQITNRLYISNNISEEQLSRLSPNIIIILNSGTETKINELCLKLGFITKNHDIIKISDKELDLYVDLTKLIFGCGDKVLIISSDSFTMQKYAAKLLMAVSGMVYDDAVNFVKGKNA